MTRDIGARRRAHPLELVFKDDEVVIHVVRASRCGGVVRKVLDEHRPVIWVSDLYGAQQGHAEIWPACLAHQVPDCQCAIEAGDSVFVGVSTVTVAA